MAENSHGRRKELIPDADPEAVRRLFEHDDRGASDESAEDENSFWLAGDDPEAQISRISDNRAAMKRQLKSEGAQFVYGLLMLAGGLGSLALAATIQTLPFIVIACIVFPLSVFWFRNKWGRWLGTAPYCYKLLTSLGEDAENVREAHEQKERQKYVRAVGDLYEHTRPGEKRK